VIRPVHRWGTRFWVTAVFAVAGGIVAGVYAPLLIQRLFDLLPAGTQAGTEKLNAQNPFTITASSLFGVIAGAGLGNLLLRTAHRVASRWDSMSAGDKLNLFIGVFAGLLISLPFTTLLSASLSGIFVLVVTLLLTLGLAALAVYALQSMGDVLPWNRGRAGKRSGIKVLDTNIIIDGRIYEIVRTGFIEGPMYVPGFVLEELQYIADSADANRRQRGRRGLDVLRRLQEDYNLEVRIHDRLIAGNKDEVDSRLVRLAKVLGADIVTNDWNLNNVAKLEGVSVLNVNDLAVAMRPNILPQENLTITVAREGNQAGQGVGYLEDGTMVVVENGRAHLGETLDVVVTQLIQTERGRMVFAKLENGAAPRG